jgi:hypothetical protein
MKTFVIGDVHGHAPLLAQLIDRAGVIGMGAEVVLLGDVGHFSHASHERDFTTWSLVDKLRYALVAQGGDLTVLWGNHDYANISPDKHGFRGFEPAFPEVRDIMTRLAPRFALEREGFLLTHAGLAPRFAPPAGTPIEVLAQVLNSAEGLPAIDDISYRRGGYAVQGGILWRDAREPLAEGIKQVFGHSRGMVRRFGPAQDSWCIDVCDKGDDASLVGLWLHDLKVVAVGPDQGIHETPWPDAE